MLIKEIWKGRHNRGVGSDPKIGNMLVQGCTNGGLRIESRSGVGCIRVRRSELMLRGCNNNFLSPWDTFYYHATMPLCLHNNFLSPRDTFYYHTTPFVTARSELSSWVVFQKSCDDTWMTSLMWQCDSSRRPRSYRQNAVTVINRHVSPTVIDGYCMKKYNWEW